MNSRFKKLYLEIAKNHLDAFLVTESANVSYLSGFKRSESYLLICPKNNFFITDFRYLQEAKKSIKGFCFLKINSSLFKTIADLARNLKIKSLGFEAKHLSFAEYEKIKEYLNNKTKFLPTYDLVEKQRQIKEPGEIKKIKQAVAITIQAFAFIKKILRPDLKETDLVAELERFVRLKGAEATAFDIIVASGANSAFPHARSQNRLITKDSSLLIDLGVDFRGYKSDLTRTFFFGKINLLFTKSYGVVLEAQKKAIQKIRPGVAIAQIDKIARNFIIHRLGSDLLGHSLGHGIGLDVHEDPSICAKNKNILKEGMVFTVEPAVYLPGKFGIRIEDMVLVTKKGNEVLSDNLDKSI